MSQSKQRFPQNTLKHKINLWNFLAPIDVEQYMHNGKNDQSEIENNNEIRLFLTAMHYTQ